MNLKTELVALVLMSAAVMTSSSTLAVVVQDLMRKNDGCCPRSRGGWYIATTSTVSFVCNLLLVGLLFKLTKMVPLSYYR